MHCSNSIAFKIQKHVGENSPYNVYKLSEGKIQ
jgi:hypothetical protein